MTVQIESLPREIVAALASAIGNAPAVLHEPSFQGNEWQYLKECLDSTFVSSVGAIRPGLLRSFSCSSALTRSTVE
jgi:hypothetical protein